MRARVAMGGIIRSERERRLAIGPTISYLKLFGNSAERDLTRIGVRTAYRF
jgi:hypothetical protein